MKTPLECPFCEPDAAQVWHSDEVGLVLWDAFPVSEGHALVAPLRHVVSIFGLLQDEQSAIWRLVSFARQRIEEEFQPAGFNIGVNDGLAAGQTVMHAHVHIIPRYENDVADPRGGVRWIIPEKAVYWEDHS